MPRPSPEKIGQFFDQQSGEYKSFKEHSFSWQYIEKPGFDRYVSDFYNPQANILDIGCGAGLVMEHLITRGCDPAKLTGVDTSQELIKEARNRLPQSRFIQTSADTINLPSRSFDLITSNMVLHYLDNSQLEKCLEEAYRVLMPDGVFFFVDTDPDFSQQARQPDNVNRWIKFMAPWGELAPLFARDPHSLLLDIPYYAGFDYEAGWPLPVSEEGQTDPKNYVKYTSYPARIAVRLRRISEQQKAFRLDNKGKTIPGLA